MTMSDEEQLVPSNKNASRHHKSFVSLRFLCAFIGILEILGFCLSLLYRSKLFNLLRLHIKHKDPTIRYAFESGQIFAAIRIGFEILQIMTSVCLCFGAIRERYHLVALNVQAVTIYAVLSPVMWWEILYFQNLHLIWITPLWLGIFTSCCYLPYKLKNKLWQKEYQHREEQEKLETDLGIEAIS